MSIKKLKATSIFTISPGSSISFELKLKQGVDFNLGDSNSYIVEYFSDGNLIASYSVKEFNEILSSSMSNNQVLKMCARDLAEKYGYKNATIVLGVLCGSNLLILIITIYCYCKKKVRTNETEKTTGGHIKYKESEIILKNEIYEEERIQKENQAEVQQKKEEEERNKNINEDAQKLNNEV